MKNENRLDDFLRQKEEEFNIPYKEEYWEKASAFIDAERGASAGRWTVANIALLSSAVIISISLLGYFVFTSNSNRKAETTVSATVNSSTVKTEKSISANNESSNTTVNAGSTTNTITGGATANTATATGVNNNNTIKNNSNSNNSSVSAIAPTSAGKTNVQSTSKSSGTVATGNAQQSNERTESSRNAVVNSGSSGEIQNTDMSPASTLKPAYFNSPFESQIPQFENMTINDMTIAVLYGLFYKSEGSAAYKKAYELHSDIYPQLGVSLTGGMNIFESFKPQNYSYVSTNPFLGAKATYQWNAQWLVQGQLNVLLRGGVNQEIPESNGGTIDPVIETNSVRNLYYVQLPVMLGYQLSKKNIISVGLGINYLVADGIQAKDSTGKYGGTYKFENGNGFNKLDYFATVAYTYRLNRKVSFSLTADYGFTNVTKDNSGNHNISLGLAINYNLFQRKVGK